MIIQNIEIEPGCQNTMRSTKTQKQTTEN